MVLEGISDCFLLQDPDSNPYGLDDGVRYHTVEINDWKQSSSPKHSKKTPPAAAETGEAPME
jgi:hypothetical protein